MKVVWRLGTATVREAHDVLRKEHRDDLAYTTVLTMMRILEQKGMLAKDADAGSRGHRYRPVRSRRQMTRVMVRELGAAAAARILEHAAVDAGAAAILSELRERRLDPYSAVDALLARVELVTKPDVAEKIA